MPKLICITLLFCCFLFKSYSQDPDTLIYTAPEEGVEDESLSEDYELPSDTILYVRNIYIAQDSVRLWKKNPSFSYMKSLDSLLRARKEELEKNEKERASERGSGRSFSTGAAASSSSVLEVILLSIAAVGILFVLSRLFLNKGVFRKNISEQKVNELNEEEILREMSDYDRRILLSVKQGDYRSAVRYQFLKTLQKLSERSLIVLAPEKTNYQYAGEIRADKQKDFSAIILNYEYVWFGHININSTQYAAIESLFNSFNNKI